MAIETGRYGNRRQQALLGVLVTVLAVALGYAWTGGWNKEVPAGGSRGASNSQRGGAPAKSGLPDLDVKLEALRAAHEGPQEVQRNPFRFEARRAQSGGEAAPAPRSQAPAPASAPTGP